MSIKPNIPVRLKATRELLFVQRVDEAAGVAYCQSWEKSGPAGPARKYSLDQLEPDVRRPFRPVF